MDLMIIDPKDESVFNMSHSGDTKITKDEVKSVEHVAVKEEVNSSDIGEAVDESITVVKHEVDEYSLESIKVVKPENKVLYLNKKPETGKKLRSCDKLKTEPDMDINNIELKDESAFNMSHSGYIKVSKVEDISVDHVAVKEEVESSDVLTDVDESIKVVHHKVDDFSLESIKVVQPENKVLYLKKKPKTEKKFGSCDKLKAQPDMNIQIIELKNESVFNTSHSGVHTITKAEEMSVDHVAVKEEVESSDVLTDVDESIKVVHHKVDDFSLESIKVVQPENKVLYLKKKPETEKKFGSCDKLKAQPDMNIQIIELKNESVFNTSHSGVHTITKAEEMSVDHVAVKEEVESSDVLTDVDESIKVVHHKVDDFSLESIKVVQPENKVLYLKKKPETEKKFGSCDKLKAQPDMNIQIIELKNESVFNTSHSGVHTITKAEEMSVDHVAVKKEIEPSDIGEDPAVVDESITVVKHEVDDYSLESIEVVQPVNKVLYLSKKPEAVKKIKSCNRLKTDMMIDIEVYNYQCERCDKRFKTRSYLLKHLRGHKMLYRCEICDQRFKEGRFLKVHMVKHTGEQPHQCEICQKKFAIPSSLFKHRKLHSGTKDFECEYCQKRFARKDGLNEHRKLHSGTKHQSDAKDFECEYCKKRFAHKSTLYKHRQLHSGTKDFECEHCKKRFVHKKYLNLHQKTHFGVKDFECEQCHMRFRQKHSLIEHIKLHSGIKDLECEYCKKRFALKKTLNEHRKLHFGTKDFECEYCKKRFAQKHNLIEHQKLHSGTKDFECELCKMLFINKRYLLKHMSVHTQERPFLCHICKKTFTWKFEVKKHIMKMHKGVDINTVVIEPCNATSVVVNIQ